MEDGEEMFSSSEMGELMPTNCSMEGFFEGILMDSSQEAACCTHTHTCNNPTGPENAHTHTCFHVHTTKILPEDSDEKLLSTDESCGKKRSLGNREAVRKYREKKKAKAASLEDEVMRLKAVNMQLVKRLQCQATLEAEVSRLKCLLVDLRGRIDGEIGSFPYQKPMAATADLPSFSHLMNPCNVQCDYDDGYGGNSQGGGNDRVLSGCEFDQIQCIANGNGNGSSNNANVSASNKRKGGHRTQRPV